MLRLSVNPNKIKSADINFIVGFIKRGAVAVLPTDTIYGLSCRADDARAIKKIRRLKRSDPKKPMLILVNSLAMLKGYSVISRRQEEILRKLWAPPARPTTVILESRGVLPQSLTGVVSGLAIRLPKSEFLLKIIKSLKRPLISTSLNLSGGETLHDLESLERIFPKRENQPDLVVNAGVCRRRKASRLIDLREEGNWQILRK